MNNSVYGKTMENVRNKNKFMNQMLRECYIKYSEELHDLHNDYPVAPEKMVIDDNFKKSPHRKTIRDKFKKEYDIKVNKSKVPKLVSTSTSIRKIMLVMQNY